jgi:hypothetical protein
LFAPPKPTAGHQTRWPEYEPACRARRRSHYLGADEHILCLIAVGWWLCCPNTTPNSRRASDDILPTAVAASALPRILKLVFDRERPDRGSRAGIFAAFRSQEKVRRLSLTARGPWPSRCSRQGSAMVRGTRAVLVVTRIILLAHWVSDVVAGLAAGALLERGFRFLTGYGGAARTSGNPRSPAGQLLGGDNHAPRGMKRRSEFIWAVNV